ncbi:TetR/AcrR family transcriptional regulator [Altericroceibacterium endophyticum]|uniref:TetR family transcriptional regulator n=1 Tax=Altericroceibacterium endophyticum TaxID=1808508 RepID=A0A6I4T5F8_9SPHN|nr:TetR/AcrR family transcriptional regulator [Altericroceibacterium endophyticum]MXO66087.1 TetR family transcriptional regulator [Altericroceibacterium endophyticum]
MSESDEVTTSCKRGARREEKRAKIVQVAQRHFTEHGFGNTTMSAIAADLGGSKTTLWSYFSSKEDLFAAALDDWIDRVKPVFDVQREGTLQETLNRYGCEFLRQMLSPQIQTLFRLMIAEGQRFPKMGHIFYERAPLRRQKALACYLEWEMAEGNFRKVDGLRASAQFHHLCFYRLFMHSMWGLEPDTSPAAIRSEVEEAVEMFLFGYATGQQHPA